MLNDKKGRLRAMQRINILKKYIKPNSVGLEIGVFAANLTEVLFEKIEGVKIYALDTWEVQNKYKTRLYGGKFDMDDIYEIVKSKLKDKNVEIIKDYSDNVHKYITEKLDWAYIDGNHSYEFVLRDLENSKKLVKKGGVILCDDFGWSDTYANGGVTKAVNEFCKKYSITQKLEKNQAILFL